jgi:hypothetical protein
LGQKRLAEIIRPIFVALPQSSKKDRARNVIVNFPSQV